MRAPRPSCEGAVGVVTGSAAGCGERWAVTYDSECDVCMVRAPRCFGDDAVGVGATTGVGTSSDEGGAVASGTVGEVCMVRALRRFREATGGASAAGVTGLLSQAVSSETLHVMLGGCGRHVA